MTGSTQRPKPELMAQELKAIFQHAIETGEPRTKLTWLKNEIGGPKNRSDPSRGEERPEP